MSIPQQVLECIRLAVHHDVPYLAVHRETDGDILMGWTVTLADHHDGTYALFVRNDTTLPATVLHRTARGEYEMTVDALRNMITGMDTRAVTSSIDNKPVADVILRAIQQCWNVAIEHHATPESEQHIPDRTILRFHAGFSMTDQPELHITITLYGQYQGANIPASYMSTANQTTLTDAITTVLRPAPCAMTEERIERLT